MAEWARVGGHSISHRTIIDVISAWRGAALFWIWSECFCILDPIKLLFAVYLHIKSIEICQQKSIAIKRHRACCRRLRRRFTELSHSFTCFLYSVPSFFIYLFILSSSNIRHSCCSCWTSGIWYVWYTDVHHQLQISIHISHKFSKFSHAHPICFPSSVEYVFGRPVSRTHTQPFNIHIVTFGMRWVTVCSRSAVHSSYMIVVFLGMAFATYVSGDPETATCSLHALLFPLWIRN